MNIGIFGSAKDLNKNDLEKAKIVGREISRLGYSIITGASSGIADEAVVEAKKHKRKNEKIVGYSPYHDQNEHQAQMRITLDAYDEIIYTGQGKKGRNLMSIKECDAGIFLKGRIGTLNEFTIAYDEGVHCAILEGMSGTCDLISEIVKIADKKSEARMFYHNDPVELVKVLDEYLRG